MNESMINATRLLSLMDEYKTKCIDPMQGHEKNIALIVYNYFEQTISNEIVRQELIDSGIASALENKINELDAEINKN